jgi:hypothetical protein
MRAREMNNKLDKLWASGDDDEPTCPDISLLSPKDQDRVHEVLAKFEGAKGVHELWARIQENIVTEAEFREIINLWAELPRLGPGESFKGPSFEITGDLQGHFRCFNSHTLKAVQKVRFVELCRKYGWEGEYPDPVRHRRCNH